MDAGSERDDNRYAGRTQEHDRDQDLDEAQTTVALIAALDNWVEPFELCVSIVS